MPDRGRRKAERIRTFVAIELPENVKRRLVRAQEELDGADLGIRWSRPETMHLTLKFLGDVAASDISEVAAACSRAASATGRGRPRVVLDQFVLFPDSHRPQVVAASVTVGEALAGLQAAVEGELAKAGFPAERRGYRPHITVGRVKARGRGKKEKLRHARGALNVVWAKVSPVLQGMELGHFTADEIVVFQSELRKGGAVHTPLARMELAGG